MPPVNGSSNGSMGDSSPPPVDPPNNEEQSGGNGGGGFLSKLFGNKGSKGGGGSGGFFSSMGDALFFRAENVGDAVGEMNANNQRSNSLMIVGLIVIAALIGGVFFIYLKQQK